MINSFSHELKELKDKLDQFIHHAKVYAEFLSSNGKFSLEEFPITDCGWEKYNEFNIDGILCSLNSPDHDITVINVKFHKGGFIPALKHDRYKTIYVVYGELEDPLNNKKFKKGDVYKLDPNVVHSLKSDDCLCTVTWEPAY